jgi:AhpC/TSA family protein
MFRAFAAVLLAVVATDLTVRPAAGNRAFVASAFVRTTRPGVHLLDVDNRVVDPFLAAEQSRVIVFLFASVDCPISNRYAPVVQRLHATFAAQGVAFWLVYPNPAETPSAIRAHVKAFGYPVHALRDPRHELVKLAKVTVTPEAAVYDRQRALVYRGRIDNRYVGLGVERPVATEHDLEDALAATLGDRRVRQATTPAVGCFIADFVP